MEESETQADTVASEEAIVDDLVSAPEQQQHSPSIPPSQAPQQQGLKRRSEAIAEKQSRPSTPQTSSRFRPATPQNIQQSLSQSQPPSKRRKFNEDTGYVDAMRAVANALTQEGKNG